MKNMKFFAFYFLANLLLVSSPTLALDAAGFCEATETATSADQGGANYNCKKTPDSLIFTIYEVGVCTAAATPISNSSCIPVFSNTAGKATNLSAGASIALDPEVTLTEGTYTHGYILVDVEQKMKLTHTFSSARTPSTGGESGGNVPGGTSGSVCYSNGNNIGVASNAISCGSDASAAAISATKAWVIGARSDNFSYMSVSYAVPGSPAAATKVWVLNSDKTQAGADYTVDAGGDWSGWSGGTTNRKYNYAVQTLASPMVISPTTTSINISFNVTGSTSFDFWEPTKAGCNGCLQDISFEGMKFNFSAQ